MEKAIFFRKTETVRSEIDKVYDEVRALIHEHYDGNIRKILNEATSLLSQARQVIYNADSYLEEKKAG